MLELLILIPALALAVVVVAGLMFAALIYRAGRAMKSLFRRT